MVRQLLVYTGRIAQPILRLKANHNVSNSTKARRPNPRHQASTLASAAARVGVVGGVGGVSLGLLGFSFGSNKKEDKETDALTLKYRDARLAHHRSDLQKADRLYKEALQIAGDMLKNKQITEERLITAKTLMYDGLADIALQTGQLEAAEALFKDTLQGCLHQGMATDDNVIVEISLKLASIYAMQEKKEEAEEGYRFCMAMQTPKMAELEKQWASQDSAAATSGGKTADRKRREDVENMSWEEKKQDSAVLLGMALGSYGRFLMYEKRYREALPLFERSRLFCKNTMGTDSNQYIVILNDISSLYIVTQNFDEAEKVISEGIAIAAKAKLAQLATLYCNLGALHLRKGDLDQARHNCDLGRKYGAEFDHKLAHRNAEACLKKIEMVRAERERKAKEAEGEKKGDV